MRKQSTAIEILDLQIFVAVVEQRSFSAAARANDTTLSATSKRVSRLEDLLGARLLERTTRSVLPTDAGASFYAHAARILSDLGEAENEISSLGGKPSGTLRVNAPLLLGERHLVPLLAGFLAKYPDVRLELTLSDTFVNLVADRVDVALRVGALVDSSLVRMKVGAARGVIVASPAYLKRAGHPETPRDLARHVCLRYANIPAAKEWRFRSPAGEMTVPVVGNLTINHGGGLREAAIAGVGIARLPDFLVADAVDAGDLVELLPGFAVEPTGIHLVHVTRGRPLPKLEAFLTEVGGALRSRLKQLGARSR